MTKRICILILAILALAMLSGCVTGKDGKPLPFDSLTTAFNKHPFGFDGSVEKVRLAQDWLGPVAKYTSTDKTIPALDQSFRTPPVGRRDLPVGTGDALVSLWSERDNADEITLVVRVFPEREKTKSADIVWRPLRVRKGQYGKLEPVIMTDEQAKTILEADADYKEFAADFAKEQAQRAAIEAKRKAAAEAAAKAQAEASKKAVKKKATTTKAKAPVVEKATEPVAVPVPVVEEPVKVEIQDPAPTPPATVVEAAPAPEAPASVVEKATETPKPEPVAAPAPKPEAPKSFLD